VIPGSVLVGATMKRPLRMANYRLVFVYFEIKGIDGRDLNLGTALQARNDGVGNRAITP